MFCQRYAASTPQCQSLLVLVRASFLSSRCTMTRPRADSTTTLHLSLYLSSLSPALPPARVSFESVHCDMRLICIVDTYPVECSELSHSCVLEMASWLFPCFSHTHTEYLGGMHPLAGAGAKAHRPDVKNMLPGGRVVVSPTVQLPG